MQTKGSTHKPEPPKELSNALKGLRFMSRKEEPSSIVKSSKAQGALSWVLPETSNLASVFSSAMSNSSSKIVYRRAIEFSNSSDAMKELVFREILTAVNQQRTKKRVRGDVALGRFRSSNAVQEDEASSVSSVDDVDIAKHFARNRKKNRRA